MKGAEDVFLAGKRTRSRWWCWEECHLKCFKEYCEGSRQGQKNVTSYKEMQDVQEIHLIKYSHFACARKT